MKHIVRETVNIVETGQYGSGDIGCFKVEAAARSYLAECALITAATTGGTVTIVTGRHGVIVGATIVHGATTYTYSIEEV